MRITLVGPTHPFRGGIAHHTTLLHRHLAARHEVDFVAFRRQYPGWLFPGRTDRDTSEHPLQAPGVECLIDSLNPATWLGAARRIVRSRPRLVIFPWWSSFWTPQFLTMATLVHRPPTRLLAICHNVVDHEERWWGRLCARAVLGRMDHCLVHSDDDEARLRTLLPAARVTRGFHPLYEFARPFLIGRAEARARLQVPAGDTILFFGFVRPYKGLDDLLRALPRVRQRRPVTLLVAGEFWAGSEDFRRQVRALGLEQAVRCVDRYVPNEEIGVYFSAADLAVLPYVSGTASGVVQTAYGLDTPVVATTVGALGDIVEDGQTGFLVPPGRPDALADAILRFFEEGRAAQFVDNIRRHKQRFAWERLVELVETIAEAPLEEAPAPAGDGGVEGCAR